MTRWHATGPLLAERDRLLRAIGDYVARSPTTGPLGALRRAAEQQLEHMLGEINGRSRAAEPHQHLTHVTRAFGLRPFERDALLLSVLAELDWQFGRLLGYVQDQPTLMRPTVGLALAVSDSDDGAPTVFDLCDGPLVRDGLLAVDGDGPLPNRTLRATPDVAARLAGTHGAARVVEPDPELLSSLVLDEAAAQIEAWAAAPSRPLLIAGGRGSGRKTVARAAAGRGFLRLVIVNRTASEDSALLARRDSVWHDAAILLVADSAPQLEWDSVWSSLGDLQRPVIVVLPLHEVEPATDACRTPPTIVRLGSPPPEARRALWRRLTSAAISDEDVDALAARFAFGPGRIARVAGSARAASSGSITGAALMSAARELGRTAMGTLGQRMALPFTRDDLVVTDRVHAELDLARAWLRHQRQVQIEWGLGRRIARGRGLTVLFAGEPGTGKTMAAQVLARELELDLYLIDLSRVLSKYIGDTEKNLARLFDEARDSGSMLFFDEGDALFGKRTETRDAHDRYANVEISYLLQRMEQHEGVTVLATNRLRDIDEAFLRRFHVIADFTLPEPADRLQIWHRMLAPPVVTDGELRLPIIAREFQLSGGQIRNAVLTAAHFAAAEGQPIAWRYLERALRRELKQQGRVFDERVSRALGVLPGR